MHPTTTVRRELAWTRSRFIAVSGSISNGSSCANVVAFFGHINVCVDRISGGMKAKIDPPYVAAVVVTVCSFSATAPLTAYAAAPALALAFWRNGLGLTTSVAIVTALRRGEFHRMYRGERRMVRGEQYRFMALGVLASLCLTAHFATFMSSAKLTSVAMSTALVATQPVWQALIAVVQGQRLPRRIWIGLSVAVIGAVTASGIDIRSGGNALLGDLLALAGALTLAGYTALSERARGGLSTPLYSTLSSFVCATGLLVTCLVTGTPLMHFDRHTEIAVLGMLVLPQLLGLGSLNFALGRGSATTTSVLLLLEAPVATVIAWLWMGQKPEPSTLPGLLLVIVGAVVVVSSSTTQSESLIGRHRAPHSRRRPRRAGTTVSGEAPLARHRVARSRSEAPRVGASVPVLAPGGRDAVASTEALAD
ncbi:DMT family transporter [Actinoallomurus rhizosphaericola]|uniref:DMT family transporter n=1 Tax=Actinoallomurus rhizosphaericola TaxID=2952536 RepID=UPI002093B778|nr:DMT family transporter [Actinoallomurus rhizosphaericola]MCO5998254.1 DMT family transporter [Actinoallomurus rhizosphaericola]